MNDLHIAIPLKRFLLIQHCPDDWEGLDLYLFRDETAAFHVGQSQFAFAHVWEHLHKGFHGHSIVGRFIWVNWPRSMNFTIELLSAQSQQFKSVGNDLNNSERLLIQHWAPCFNTSLNSQPTKLPETYFPPNAQFRHRRSLNQLIHDAERGVKSDETNLWMQEMKLQ